MVDTSALDASSEEAAVLGDELIEVGSEISEELEVHAGSASTVQAIQITQTTLKTFFKAPPFQISLLLHAL